MSLLYLLPSVDPIHHIDHNCQQDNDTGNIFLCEFSNECIEKKPFSYHEFENSTILNKLLTNINVNQLCDGSCDCGQYDNSE